VAPGERKKSLNGAIEVDQQDVEGGPEIEHKRAVDEVLVHSAPVDIARGSWIGFGNLRPQCLDHGKCGIAAGCRGLCKGRKFITFRTSCGRDVVESKCRNGAISKSSMRCRRARSCRASRMAALE
jgi:hypothetical protein